MTNDSAFWDMTRAMALKSVKDPEPAIRNIADVPSISTFENLKVEWVVDGVIPAAIVAMFSGTSGDGKTTVALAIAGSAAHGAEFGGRAVAKRPVLILDRENPLHVISERFHRLGMKDGESFRYWGTWLSEEAPAPASPIVQEWVIQCDPKPLIVVDSLVAFMGADENSAAEARAFMQQLRALANLGATVIVLHHSGKGETSQDYRGSSDFKASIDVGYVVSNIGPDPATLEHVRLKNFKSRVQVAGEVLLRFDGVQFVAEEGAATPSGTNESLLRELLEENPGVTVREFQTLAVSRNLGRNRAWEFLNSNVQRGTVTVHKGEHNARRHTWSGSFGGLLQ